MGTRSDIIVQRVDGKWARIYCHWDGYLSRNGRLLNDHYNSQELAEKLTIHGDLSSLAESCDKPAGHSFDNRVKGYSVYYGRDRGEKGTETKVFDTLETAWPAEDTWTEYTYVWGSPEPGKPVQWYVGNPDEGKQTLVPLAEALTGKHSHSFPIKAFGMTLGVHAPTD